MTTTPEGRREPLSAEERDDLRVLALRATQGPWKADGTIYEHMVSEIRSIVPGEERGIAQVWQHPQGFADARFIAAANPATVLSLLAENEELRARAEASAQREAGLREALTSAALNLDACAVAIRKGGKSEGRHTLVEGWAERARAALTKSETPSDV